MRKTRVWTDCIVAVVPGAKLTVVLQAPYELIAEMDDCFIDYHVLSEGGKTLPTEVGIYRVDIEEWFENYEDPDWELRLSNVRKIELT